MTFDPYSLVKTLHILSSTLLFGTGLGTAFHMYATHRSGDVAAIARTAKNVVRADWAFTATSGVAQPVTGVALILMAGHDPWASWLVPAYGLYVLAGGCWLVVVRLQIRMARLSQAAARDGASLPPAYHAAMRLWFRLGWPAFLGLVVVFWLMTAKPALW